MKAIILAAGYGNRMRPLTDNLHKTMVTVAGKTIIGRIIEGLLENDISDIVVVTGYRAEELKNYLTSTFTNVKFTFVHNEKFRETNNIYLHGARLRGHNHRHRHHPDRVGPYLPSGNHQAAHRIAL